jgi:hypothetical protein
MASRVMNHKVKIIKRGDRKEPKLDLLEQPRRHTTQEITTTLKLWVSEFKERRRTTEDRTRTGNKRMNNAESVG